MHSDGKQLEALVAYAEKLHLPPGFKVATNSKVLNDEGAVVAEFDIEISGKVGTTDFSWLIECRDRPSGGAAPSAWIEQLVGRRDRFGFNKVTAVSTTGFSAGASDYAREADIELREVLSLAPESFGDWLELKTLTQILRVHDLKDANFLLEVAETTERWNAAMEAIKASRSGDAVLVSSKTGESVTPNQVFIHVVQTSDAFAGVTPDAPRSVTIRAEYPTDDHYVLSTSVGNVRIMAIEFRGELRIEKSEYPVVSTNEYRHLGSGEPISQVVSFAPQTLHGQNLSFELHRVPATGQIHVVARKLPK